MECRKFTREFNLEAVRLIKDRGVSHVQASHLSQLRDWVKKFAEDPQHAFPGNVQMKPSKLRSRVSSAKPLFQFELIAAHVDGKSMNIGCGDTDHKGVGAVHAVARLSCWREEPDLLHAP